MVNELSKGKNALYVLVLALVIALYLFANSTLFETDSIEWTGLSNLNQAQMDRYADFSLTNVWRVDGSELAATLMEHPWVETATVKWRWPNRIIVKIEEKTPIAQMPTAGGWVLLDREGGILPAIDAGVMYSLPIVTNCDLSSTEQLVAAARLINMIPAKLQGSISEWNASSRSFVSRTGTEIIIGQPVDLEEKFILLEKILEDLSLRNERAKRIDLRVPKNPVINIS